MGCGSPKAPAAPDPAVTIRAQEEANNRQAQQQFDLNTQTARQTATRDRVNQVTPFGSLTYATDPNNPDAWTATQSLSPELQARLAQVYQTISNPINLDAIGASTSSARDALLQRLNPSLDTQRTGLETRLRNQGLMPGSEAWTTAMRDVSQSENDARLAALTQADGFANSALSRYITARQAPLNEFSQLIGNNSYINARSAATANTNLSPTDALGSYQMQQAQLNNNYKEKAANYRSNLEGLYSVAAAAAGTGSRAASSA